MRGKLAKALRRLAEIKTVGMPPSATRTAYKRLKRIARRTPR